MMELRIGDDAIAPRVPRYQPAFSVAHEHEPVGKIRIHPGAVGNRPWRFQLFYWSSFFPDTFQVPEADKSVSAGRQQSSAVGVKIKVTDPPTMPAKRGNHLQGVKTNDANKTILVAQRE